MTIKLLTKHHLEFLSVKGGCRGSSESTLDKLPHCWKSHVGAHIYVTCLSLITRDDPFELIIKDQQFLLKLKAESSQNTCSGMSCCKVFKPALYITINCQRRIKKKSCFTKVIY